MATRFHGTGISRLAFDRYLASRFERTNSTFENARKNQIELVISSSPYLTALKKGDSQKATAKAIQAIRRDPDRDRSETIGLEEKQALEKVRSSLSSPAWLYYKPGDLYGEIKNRAERNGKKRFVGYQVASLARQFERRNQHRLDALKSLIFETSNGRCGPRLLRKTIAALEIFSAYDVDGLRDINPNLVSAIVETIRGSVRLRLTQFLCLQVNAQALHSANPIDYFPRDARGCFSKHHRVYLRELITDLSTLGIETELLLILADTDPFYYFFPVIRAPNIHKDTVKRSATHKQSFISRYDTFLGSVNHRVLNWSDFEARDKDEIHTIFSSLLGQVSYLFSEFDLKSEAQVLEQEFKRGGYHAGCSAPTPSALREMAIRRCALYSAQGQYLRNSEGKQPWVHLQCESPSWLRTRMLNAALARSGNPAPVINRR